MSFRITIIDDDVDLRNLMQIALKYEGYDVVAYENAAKFLENHSRDAFSEFYVIDINLGGITGAELCRTLREDEKTKGSYIILISANPEVEQLANESGANDYLLKPFSQKELTARIKAVVQ